MRQNEKYWKKEQETENKRNREKRGKKEKKNMFLIEKKHTHIQREKEREKKIYNVVYFCYFLIVLKKMPVLRFSWNNPENRCSLFSAVIC